MFRYEPRDEQLLRERASQFRDQIQRRLSGELTEAAFKPLRLQNGLYMQLHAYMLRLALPYGQLRSEQLRALASVSRRYDRGYAHITTRQNVQLNWIRLEEVPDLLEELAAVHLHAIQTSGNCVRSVTTDALAGVAPDELEDPRPYCELLRQWSTLHPEFAFLPRKFKIAVIGASEDRAAIAAHDIGLRLREREDGEIGFEVWVGGGQGRNPVLAKRLREWLPKAELLSYTEAILRVYNLHGRRDNKHKARIKVLVGALGLERFKERVEQEWERVRAGGLLLREEDLEAMRRHFAPPAYASPPIDSRELRAARLSKDRGFARWADANALPHRMPGYRAVVVALKSPARPPGDLTADQLDAIADLADEYSFGEARTTHRQNLVLPDVESWRLPELFARLEALELASPSHARITDIISCPGLDYCNLASARSIALAEAIQTRFAEPERVEALGELHLNISGCVNACGHHHVGTLGILGIDKQGTEGYQLMLGGSIDPEPRLGKVLGRALDLEGLVDAIDRVMAHYLQVRRSPKERFIDVYLRVGPEPFKEVVYADHPPPRDRDRQLPAPIGRGAPTAGG